MRRNMRASSSVFSMRALVTLTRANASCDVCVYVSMAHYVYNAHSLGAALHKTNKKTNHALTNNGPWSGCSFSVASINAWSCVS